MWAFLHKLFFGEKRNFKAALVMVSHYENDPDYPHLVIKVPLPANPSCLPFLVRGMNIDNIVLDSPAGRAANCHVTICEVINFARRYYAKLPCIWAATDVLDIDPQAGEQLNSYYDRAGLRFFYATDPQTQQIMYCSNSTDVVSHELGHAILDAIRPDLWNVQGFEIWGFHEAFGDCIAILHAMEHAEVVIHALKQTDHDLRKSNIISKIAEQFGTTMYHTVHAGDPLALRDAVNKFHYVLPETLPHQASSDELSAEPHSFSRVFLGAWYDLLVGIYEKERHNGHPATEAAVLARNVAGAYLLQALPLAAASPRFYNAVAMAILAIDHANNDKYHDIVMTAFTNRHILSGTTPFLSMSDMSWNVLKPQLNGHDQVYMHPNGVFVRTSKIRTVSMQQRVGITDNPLYELKMDVPTDEYYEFDIHGKLVQRLIVNGYDVNMAVSSCLNYLHKLNYVGSTSETPFEVKDGKLVRSHFDCGDGSFINNSSIPGAPEYGKPWKPANNCGCGDCFKPEVKKALQKVKTGCFIRSVTGRVNAIQVGGTKSIRTC